MDYSKLEFNPFDLGDQLMWEKYELLQSNPVFCGLTDEDHARGLTAEDLSILISFVVLYIDNNSPFYKQTDIARRIKGCCDALKIKKGSVVWREIETHSDTYSNLVYEYFRMQNSILFESWLSLKTGFHELNKIMRQPIGLSSDVELEASRRSKTQLTIDELSGKLLKKEAKLFPSQAIQNQINLETIKDQLSGYAEQHAKYHPLLRQN